MKFQKMMKNIISIKTAILLILPLVVLVLSCSEDEEVYPRTRLFKPVLQDQLFSIDNTIVVDISKSKEALNYELEVSRDTFKTIEYRFSMDTTYAVINEGLVGEELLWNTIYQVRAKAFADESEYNSRVW
jgi:hypothetical protein